MKSASILSSLSTIALTLSALHDGQVPLRERDRSLTEKFLIELAPGDMRWVTEDEKWEFRRKGRSFFDITDSRNLKFESKATAAVKFPPITRFYDSVKPMLEELQEQSMRKHLEKFTSFHTRYFRSHYGAESSAWLLSQVNRTIADAGAFDFGVKMEPLEHPWVQSSIIATVPGRSNKTVIIGAHQDSANRFSPSLLAAPGADDDGSGTVTILEVLRVLLTSDDVLSGKAENTIEFHWYSAEEGGLLGSQSIFYLYAKERRQIKTMFQQDMTGYIQKTLDANKPESFGVITDYVDLGLTEFIKKVITTYCDIPYVLTQCGHACSDHASATKAGYPSAFVFESEFKYLNGRIHTADDIIKYLSFSHMLQHARLTLGLVYELSFTNFE